MENIPRGDGTNVNPMIAPQHQGTGAAPGPQNAPNISPANKQSQALMGAVSGLLGGLASDSDPKSYTGILHAPPPRQSAVSINNNNQIHVTGNTIADPAGLSQAIQERQNSRFLGVTGGLPQGGVGSP